MRKPLSLYHPVLYWLRVNQRRLFKKLAWYCSNRRYAHTLQPHNKLTHRYIKHTSKLIRHFAGVDLHLQHNKVTNLKIAVDCVNGIVIQPHDYFSFCKLVGKVNPRSNAVLLKEWNYRLVKHKQVLAAAFAN